MKLVKHFNQFNLLYLELMIKRIIFGLALISMGFIGSCTKDEANPDDITGKNNQQIFMMKTWRSISFTDSSFNGVEETLSECDKDDQYTFTSTTKYTWKANGVCNPDDETTKEVSWSMKDPAGKEVFFFGYTWTIEKISGTDIVLRRRYLDNQANVITWRMTLIK